MIRFIITILFVFLMFHCSGDKPVLITLSGEGEVELIPDMASVSVTAACVNKNLVKANECAKDTIAGFFGLLNEYKISKEDYHSSQINLQKDYIWRNNSQVFNGYESSSVIYVVFKDIKIISEVITRTMNMKNVEVSNLSYSHSRLDEISNEAYLKAIDKANLLANLMKEKLNGKSVEIIQINNVSDNFADTSLREYEYKNVETTLYKKAANSNIQVNPGKLKIRRDIYVLYRVGF